MSSYILSIDSFLGILSDQDTLSVISSYGSFLGAVASTAAVIFSLYQSRSSQRPNCMVSLFASDAARIAAKEKVVVNIANTGLLVVPNIKLFVRRFGCSAPELLDLVDHDAELRVRIDLGVGQEVQLLVSLDELEGWIPPVQRKLPLRLPGLFPRLCVVDATGRSYRAKMARGLWAELRRNLN